MGKAKNKKMRVRRKLKRAILNRHPVGDGRQ